MVRIKPECKCAIDRYGYTDNHDDAGFIMPDGKMLDLDYAAVPHEDVGQCLSDKKERYGDYAISTWLEKCNAIRVNAPHKVETGGSVMFEAVSKPTTEQMDVMRSYFTEYSEWPFIGYRNKCPKGARHGEVPEDGCLCSFHSSDIHPWTARGLKMDVQRWISKCW